MTLANRGTKRRCPNCGTPYYDLGRSPVVCPKCQAPYVEAQKPPARVSRARAEPVLPADEPVDDAVVFDEDSTLEGEGEEELDSDILRDEDQNEDDADQRD